MTTVAILATQTDCGEAASSRIGRGPAARGSRGAFGIFAVPALCAPVLPVGWRQCRCAGCRHLQFGGRPVAARSRYSSRSWFFGRIRAAVGNETERGGWLPWTVLDCWHCRLVGPESDSCTVDQAGGPAAAPFLLGELAIRP
jgi:hypothetical protein